MIYIGSTSNHKDRFYSHLETGKGSNLALQESIKKYGLKYFNLYVFEELSFIAGESKAGSQIRLRNLEQSYIDKFNKGQLYNAINSTSY